VEMPDKADIEKYFRDNKTEAAEYTFPNLFAWRAFDKAQVTILNNNLCILSTQCEGGSFCFVQPIGDEKLPETIDACMRYLEKKRAEPKLLRVTESFVEEYKLKDKYSCQLDRDNSDYVYQVSDLAELKGRKYDAKRNHIKKVRERADHQYQELKDEMIPLCHKVLDVWVKNKSVKEDVANLETLYYGEKAIREYLDNFKALALFGGVIQREGHVVAFTIASPLSKDTAVIYVEVGLPEEKQINQLLNQEFCKNGLKDFKYVNREQDLGHEGLRKAKMSYHPHHFVNKYIITEKK
jgi:hypothetical protein